MAVIPKRKGTEAEVKKLIYVLHLLHEFIIANDVEYVNKE